nr:uncharacterized protein LOC129130791 [Agelaius phoeniceus]
MAPRARCCPGNRGWAGQARAAPQPNPTTDPEADSDPQPAPSRVRTHSRPHNRSRAGPTTDPEVDSDPQPTPRWTWPTADSTPTPVASLEAGSNPKPTPHPPPQPAWRQPRTQRRLHTPPPQPSPRQTRPPQPTPRFAPERTPAGPAMELEEDFDMLDPERLIQCPLVKHHWIRARRFPYHLVKCKESNPEIAKKLATCPFNARHLVPQADLSNHIMKCNDKAFVEQDVVSRSSESSQEQLNNGSTWQAPPSAEDWETDLLEGSESTFVWGVINSAMNSPISDQNNSLPSRMRPPETLPYSVSAGLIRSISSSPWNVVLPQQ